MSTRVPQCSTLSIPRSLKVVGLAAGSIGVLEIVLSTIAYAVVKPGFDLLATYLSDIGATSFAVIRLFIGEGIVMGVLSWLIALPFSYPAAQALGNMVGNLLLRAPLDFAYSMEGAVNWLLIVIGLSALASLLPALRAAQISVRETLAYE